MLQSEETMKTSPGTGKAFWDSEWKNGYHEHEHDDMNSVFILTLTNLMFVC